MDRGTRLALVGVIIAALPVFPQIGDLARASPLITALFLLGLLLLAFADTSALGRRLSFLRLDRRQEHAYLGALVTHVELTPALLAARPGGVPVSDFALDAVFTPLTLRPRLPADASPAPPDRGGRLRGDPEADDGLGVPTLHEQIALGLLTAGILGALGLLAAQQIGPLLWPLGVWRPTIGGVIGGILWTAGIVLAGGLYWQLVRPSLRRTWRLRQISLAAAGSPAAAIWTHRRLLILGGPGSGKTSLLRYIALLTARERLGRRADQVRALLGWPETPFPIFIPLRALTKTSGTLLERYAAALSTDGGELLGPHACACTAAFFDTLATRGGCLFLIDSFDELRDATARTKLAELVADLPPGPPNRPNRIVVSSRPVGYEGQLQQRTFSHQDLAPLDAGQIAELVRVRYRAIGAVDPQLARHEVLADRLIKRIPEHAGLRRLSETPMLLSLVVALHYDQRGRDLPDERYLLFERVCRHLVIDWEPARAAAARPAHLVLAPDPTDLKDDQKLRLLRELAWTMYERSGDDAGSHTVIRNDAAETSIAHTLATVLDSGGRGKVAFDEHCAAEAARWLRNLEQTGGLLRERGNEAHTSLVQVQFAHQALQEYMAAWAGCAPELASADREARAVRLLERWAEPRLHEVLVLYAALSDATPVVQHLLAQQTPLALKLAGEVLLENPLTLTNAARDAALARLRAASLDAPDPAAAEALASLGTLRDAGRLPEPETLLAAIGRASEPLAVIERLGDLARNQPTNRMAAPQLQRAMLTLLETAADPALRIAAANAMARNDPRYAAELPIPDLVRVPAGRYLLGAAAGDSEAFDRERPQRAVELPEIWIGRTPVTNAEYRAFVADKGYSTQRYWSAAGWRWVQAGLELFPLGTGLSDPQSWVTILTDGWLDPWIAKLRRVAPFTQPWTETWDDQMWNGDSQPVVGICGYEAEAYCRWLSAKTGQTFFLPSEWAWEAAARGTDGRTYPWEGGWEEGRCNNEAAGIGRPTPVGSYPAGTSPCGAQDMAGNVNEWTASRLPRTQRKSYRQLSTVGLLLALSGSRVLRGGSWYNASRYVRAPYRNSYNPRNRYYGNGVRVASRSPVRRPES